MQCVQLWDVRTRKLKVDLPGHADEVSVHEHVSIRMQKRGEQ